MSTRLAWISGFIAVSAYLALMWAPAVLAGEGGEGDNWIGRDAVHSAAGEWCCGIADCGVIPSQFVHPADGGFSVRGYVQMQSNGGWRDPVDEFVPQSEVQPSPDGAYWRCRRPDKSRRCFFAPPPGS